MNLDTAFYWIYNRIYTRSEILNQIIGSSSELTASDVTANDDTTSVYVKRTGSDVSGTGTKSSPYATIHTAITNIGSKTIITILDSNDYYCNISGKLYIELNAITLQGDAGTSPRLIINTSVASCTEMVTMTSSAVLKNVRILGNSSYATAHAGISILSGTIQNVSISGTTREGIVAGSGTVSTVNINYTTIQDVLNSGTVYGNGIYIDEGTWNINRCLINGCERSAIYIVGSTAKTINIDYNTISDNFYGIYANGSTNETITADDSIIFGSRIFDHYGTTGTFTRCCIGSMSSSSPILTNCIRFNPLFISTTDFRLRSVHNEYTTENMTSPAIGVSATGKDLGCYDYSRYESLSAGTSFYTERSDVYKFIYRNVDTKTYYSLTGTYYQYKKTNEEVLQIAWQTMTDDELENLLAMYKSNTDVYLSTLGDTGELVRYKIDISSGFEYQRPLNKDDMDLWDNISLYLVKA